MKREIELRQHSDISHPARCLVDTPLRHRPQPSLPSRPFKESREFLCTPARHSPKTAPMKRLREIWSGWRE